MKQTVHILTFLTLSVATTLAFHYHSYMPWPDCNSKEQIRAPKSFHELRSLVIKTGLHNEKLKAIGARHSATEIICTEGTPIDMKHFNRIRLEEDNSVTVGCGATLENVLETLHRHERTLVQFPSIGTVTICGAIGTGAHGSVLNKPTSLSDQIISMRIIDGLGQIKLIEGDDLDVFRINFGLLGILIEVTLETVPSFKLQFSRKVKPDSFLTSGEALRLAKNSDYLQLRWFLWQKKVAVIRGLRKSPETEGTAFTPFYGESEPGPTAEFQAAYDALQDKRHYAALHAIEENTLLGLTEKVVGGTPILTEDGVTMKNPAVGWNFKLIMASCKKCGWSFGKDSFFTEDTSAGCDIRELPNILEMIRNVAKIMPFQLPLSGVNLRFHQESKAILSMAHGKPDGVVIVEIVTPARTDFKHKPRAGLAALQAISQALVSKFGCRPHWGKNGEAFRTRSLLESVFDTKVLDLFAQKMKQYDPLGIFRNRFSSQLFDENRDTANSSGSDVHCALQDNCFCKTDLNCLSTEQTCETFQDYESLHAFKVCQDRIKYKDTPMGHYNPRNLSDIFRAAME